jgi:hypothetical protein
MEDEQVILSFKGEFSAELLTSILHIMESKMLELSIPMQMKKRVFNVLVECFQNLYHHIDKDYSDAPMDAAKNSALVMVKYVDNKIMVLTGNYIPKGSTQDLKQKLVLVNELDEKELRELYQQRLLNNSHSLDLVDFLNLELQINYCRVIFTSLLHIFIVCFVKPVNQYLRLSIINFL